ncbi:MAG: hypothetical protein KIT17_24275, partial [Rubrivivax sp.]|nr:hypothetical protein [Rubrivivax sp.]
DGAALAVPAGALAQDVALELQADPTTAPPLPAGLLALGKVYAATPHGTAFALPAQVTVPFDPLRAPGGVPPVLYKADGTGPAAGQWRPVPGASASGGTMSAEVTSLSYLVVAPPLEFQGIHREWDFWSTYRFTPPQELAAGHEDTTAMAVVATYDIGPAWFADAGNTRALARVFSSSTGSTYGIGVESPAGPQRFDAVGATGTYRQVQYFRKRDEAATLSFLITQALVRAADFDPRRPECNPEGGGCRLLRGYVDMTVTAYDQTANTTIFARKSGIAVVGSYEEWLAGVVEYAHQGEPPLWREGDFEVQDVGTLLRLLLARPLRVHVPIDTVAVGNQIVLDVRVDVEVNDRRQSESVVNAFLRDPQDPAKGGLDFEYTGLDRDDPHRAPPLPPLVVQPAPTCAGAADPAAGTLQFSAPAFVLDERAGAHALVFVSRTGGSRGRVSVRLATGGGSAAPGTHYLPLSQHVAFADGDEGTRAVPVALVDDGTPNPNRTVQLALDDVRGCATLGAQASALLTIADDDYEIVEATYRVGGTVTGLAGSGLVLEDRAQFVDIAIAADGAFQFDRSYTGGAAYDVRVKTPPTNPAQQCAVTRRTGTVGTASVTDIVVACATPPPASGLDPAFGAGSGIVTAGPAGIARAIALQPDGRIVAAIGPRVARYLADGTLDTSFGSGGSVADVLGGSGGSEIADLAVMPDGRIVAVGSVRTSLTSVLAYDYGVARLNADGSVDASFNGGNVVHVDWIGAPDHPQRVLLQRDGKIVVAGIATTVYTPTTDDSAFGVARLNADGSLDTGFGTGGRAAVELAQLDFAHAAALQADGKIVIAGRVSRNRGDESDVGVARLNADGTPDAGFGSGGQVLLDLSPNWDEAVDLVVQPDGRLLLAVAWSEVGNFAFGLLRLNADGSRDAAFGSDGFVFSHFGTGNDTPTALALQADGAIVVAGSTIETATSFDFVVARFRADGAPDPTFAGGGLLRLNLFNGRDGAYDVLVQPDGRLLASGFAGSGLSTLPLLVRLHH